MFIGFKGCLVIVSNVLICKVVYQDWLFFRDEQLVGLYICLYEFLNFDNWEIQKGLNERNG